MQERGFVIFKCLIFRLMQNVNETFSRDITQKQAKGFIDLISIQTGQSMNHPRKAKSVTSHFNPLPGIFGRQTINVYHRLAFSGNKLLVSILAWLFRVNLSVVWRCPVTDIKPR
jgi:hypothetical protein